MALRTDIKKKRKIKCTKNDLKAIPNGCALPIGWSDWKWNGYRPVPGRGQVTSILDVGTGSGLFAEVFFKRGLEVSGVDANPEMLIAARQFVPKGIFVKASPRRCLTRTTASTWYSWAWSCTKRTTLESFAGSPPGCQAAGWPSWSGRIGTRLWPPACRSFESGVTCRHVPESRISEVETYRAFQYRLLPVGSMNLMAIAYHKATTFFSPILDKTGTGDRIRLYTPPMGVG